MVTFQHALPLLLRAIVIASRIEIVRIGERDPNLQVGQRLTSDRGPILVSILWQKLARICRKGSGIGGGLSRCERRGGKTLEVVHIDPGTFGIQYDKLGREREIP